MTPEQATKYRFDPFDITKVWPTPTSAHCHRTPGAEQEPENYFAEVEQSAFSPGNFVPASPPPPTRCSRAASSATTTTIGTGSTQLPSLPVNAPRPARWITSRETGHALRRQFRRQSELLSQQLRRTRAEAGDSGTPVRCVRQSGPPEVCPSQRRLRPGRSLYKKVMTDADRDHLVGNIVDHLGGARSGSSIASARSSTRRTRITAGVSPRAEAGFQGSRPLGRHVRRESGQGDRPGAYEK